MHPIPSSRFVAFALAAAFVFAGSGVAHAGDAYSLHVHMARSASGHGLDLAMPWELDHGGSPFDFAEGIDSPGLERLGAAWATLRRLPEGRAITIEGDHDDLRAWREHGQLVLEPLDSESDSHVRIPGAIVEAILRRHGRLTNADLADMLRHRSGISLVEVTSDHGRVEVWIGRDED